MKKITLILVFLLTANILLAQTFQKSSGEGYGGVGLSLVFFTQEDVWNIYPFLDVSSTSFMTEITPYIGYKFNKSLAVEFAPGILINRSYSKDGFYFQSNNVKQYYVPQNVTMVSIPLNARVKLFPFAAKSMVSDFVSGIYFGLGAGGFFVSESYDNYIYADKNSQTPIGTIVSKKNSWTSNMQIFAGFELQGRFGLGVELGYRIVPLKLERDIAVVSAIAPNMNYFFINFKGGLGF